MRVSVMLRSGPLSPESCVKNSDASSTVAKVRAATTDKPPFAAGFCTSTVQPAARKSSTLSDVANSGALRTASASAATTTEMVPLPFSATFTLVARSTRQPESTTTASTRPKRPLWPVPRTASTFLSVRRTNPSEVFTRWWRCRLRLPLRDRHLQVA